MDIKDLFKPYKGKEGYIFVSYNHADSDIVYDIISELHSRGYRIWHDNGIPHGANFVDKLADEITNCSVFFSFLSTQYINSDYCKSELHYAFSEKRTVIPIKLDHVKLPSGIKFRFAAINYISLYKFDSVKEMVDHMCELDEEILAPCHEKTRGAAGQKTDIPEPVPKPTQEPFIDEDDNSIPAKITPAAPPPPWWKKYGVIIAVAAVAVIAAAVLFLRPGKKVPESSLPETEQQVADASKQADESSSEEALPEGGSAEETSPEEASPEGESPETGSVPDKAEAGEQEGEAEDAKETGDAKENGEQQKSEEQQETGDQKEAGNQQESEVQKDLVVNITPAEPKELIVSGRKTAEYLRNRLEEGTPLSVYDLKGNEAAESDPVYDNAIAALALLAESSQRNSSTNPAGVLLDSLADYVGDGSSFSTKGIAALSAALLRADKSKTSFTYVRTAQNLLDQVIENRSGTENGFCTNASSEDRSVSDNILLYSAYRLLYDKTGNQAYKEASESAESFIQSMRSEDSSYYLAGDFKDAPGNPEVVPCEPQALAAIIMNDRTGIEQVSGLRMENGCFSPDSASSFGSMECTSLMALAYQKLNMNDLAAESLSAVYSYQLENGGIPESDSASAEDAFGREYTNTSRTSAEAWYTVAAFEYNPFD